MIYWVCREIEHSSYLELTGGNPYLALTDMSVIRNLEVIVCLKTTLIAQIMGPTWGPPGAGRTQVGPMLAPWTLLSGKAHCAVSKFYARF